MDVQPPEPLGHTFLLCGHPHPRPPVCSTSLRPLEQSDPGVHGAPLWVQIRPLPLLISCGTLSKLLDLLKPIWVFSALNDGGTIQLHYGIVTCMSRTSRGPTGAPGVQQGSKRRQKHRGKQTKRAGPVALSQQLECLLGNLKTVTFHLQRDNREGRSLGRRPKGSVSYLPPGGGCGGSRIITPAPCSPKFPRLFTATRSCAPHPLSPTRGPSSSWGSFSASLAAVQRL